MPKVCVNQRLQKVNSFFSRAEFRDTLRRIARAVCFRTTTKTPRYAVDDAVDEGVQSAFLILRELERERWLESRTMLTDEEIITMSRRAACRFARAYLRRDARFQYLASDDFAADGQDAVDYDPNPDDDYQAVRETAIEWGIPEKYVPTISWLAVLEKTGPVVDKLHIDPKTVENHVSRVQQWFAPGFYGITWTQDSILDAVADKRISPAEASKLLESHKPRGDYSAA